MSKHIFFIRKLYYNFNLEAPIFILRPSPLWDRFWPYSGQIQLQTLLWIKAQHIAIHKTLHRDFRILVRIMMMMMMMIYVMMVRNKLHDVVGDDDSRWYPGPTVPFWHQGSCSTSFSISSSSPSLSSSSSLSPSSSSYEVRHSLHTKYPANVVSSIQDSIIRIF